MRDIAKKVPIFPNLLRVWTHYNSMRKESINLKPHISILSKGLKRKSHSPKSIQYLSILVLEYQLHFPVLILVILHHPVRNRITAREAVEVAVNQIFYYLISPLETTVLLKFACKRASGNTETRNGKV